MRAVALAVALLLASALGAGGCGGGDSSSAPTSTSASTTATTPEGATDSSIEGYGGAAKGSEKAAVSAAVHSFLGAMAAGDYAGMCSNLAASNREQLQAFGQGEAASGSGCAGALKTLLNPAVAKEARAAAAARITSVRIKGDTAFALFTPKGGVQSYLVVKREGDSWKSISVTPGTPLEPTAGQ